MTRDIPKEIEDFLTRVFARKMQGVEVDDAVGQQMWEDFVDSFAQVLKGRAEDSFAPADVESAMNFYETGEISATFLNRNNSRLGTVLDSAKMRFMKMHIK